MKKSVGLIIIFALLSLPSPCTSHVRTANIRVSEDGQGVSFTLSIAGSDQSEPPCITGFSVFKQKKDKAILMWGATNDGRCENISVIRYGVAPRGFHQFAGPNRLSREDMYVVNLDTGPFLGSCKFYWSEGHIKTEGQMCN
jgi:hypothetical protein